MKGKTKWEKFLNLLTVVGISGILMYVLIANVVNMYFDTTEGTEEVEPESEEVRRIPKLEIIDYEIQTHELLTSTLVDCINPVIKNVGNGTAEGDCIIIYTLGNRVGICFSGYHLEPNEIDTINTFWCVSWFDKDNASIHCDYGGVNLKGNKTINITIFKRDWSGMSAYEVWRLYHDRKFEELGEIVAQRKFIHNFGG